MVTFHIQTCRHGIEISQICDKCVALSDAPQPQSDITDPINHPPHYTQHPSGVECITITEHYNFNTGNAIKYLWRAGLKDGTDAASDLRKAAWYVQREIERVAEPANPYPVAKFGDTPIVFTDITAYPDFPPVETQAQVAAAYADRYGGQRIDPADLLPLEDTASLYGDHIAAHNASGLPWGDTHDHRDARLNALLIHSHLVDHAD